MEYLKLIGILIIVVGFALKWDVIAVVLISGLVTGLVSGLDFVQILEIMGKAFVDNRLMSIFLISFPAIALIERYGMKERAAELIGKIKNATAGKVLSIYMVVRILASAMSIRLGGHVQFVRPLILPMSEAAGETSIKKPLIEKQSERIKGLAAAVENYGNFFGQNIFLGNSGVLLIQGTLAAAGYEVTLGSIAQASIPVGIVVTIFTIIQVLLADRKLKKEAQA
ncbi:DUF969 domain-containing protein [Holdemania filiformis]|uniref:DUF969 domain-containing protein n=1 Tax=Holdemania filiformis TaxID=61171 RepID=A0A412FNZ3_9FIRM|nr:DUF969 domain-containing protein [Holdemania filiformis]MBS5003035.1 DUF969 domain-containing protein [Holdemania filiformis]RGR69888.1 DUF969 domain-containing protein [Holdemania filiformis]